VGGGARGSRVTLPRRPSSSLSSSAWKREAAEKTAVSIGGLVCLRSSLGPAGLSGSGFWSEDGGALWAVPDNASELAWALEGLRWAE
jgi:hypothetical protein